MAGFYESKRDGTVANAMAKYGMDMTLVVPAAGVFDGSDGSFSPGTDALYPVRGLNGQIKKARGDAMTNSKTRFIYLACNGLAVEPSNNHKLRVGDVDYEIMDVEPLAPGGITVMYQLQVRQP
jgi:hypothetical protein